MIRTEMEAADLTSSVMAAPEGEAFFELGMKYASGRSGPADLVTAHKWFNVAFSRAGIARRRVSGASLHARCRLRRSQRRSARHASSSLGTDLGRRLNVRPRF